MGISKPDTVLNTLDSLSLKGGNVVDDCCDKLISHVFVYVLILFAVIAGIHEYSGTTINCLPHSKDGKVTDDMVKHLNRFCVTQTLYYYDDFWKPTQLPPVNGPSGCSSPPATTLPTPASSNTSSPSTDAAVQPPPSDGQVKGRAKRSTFEGSLSATERSETTSGSRSESQATSVGEETTTSKSSGNSESTPVSASSSQVSSSASKVSETTTEATTERSSASATSAVSGKEESTQTASTVTQTPSTSSKKTNPTSEGTTTSQTQSIHSTPQKSTATTSFPVGGQKTGSTTPTTSGSKATTEKDQEAASSTLATSATKTSATSATKTSATSATKTSATSATKTSATSATKTSLTAGHQAPTTENSASEEHKDLHPMTSQHVHTKGGESLYANEITHMITVVFVLQAIILKLPQILWKELLEKTGTNLQTLITRLMDEQFEDPAKREMTIKKFACNLPKAVKSDTMGLLQRKGWRRGQKLITFFQSNIFWLYISIKLFYIVVLVFQGWLLSTFFAFNFRDFGVSVITKDILKQPINYVTDFPTVVLCNFRSPTLDMPWEGVWVQCVLVFNNFLQNMLLIEWLGILILSIVMVLSISNWIYWRWSEQSNITLIHNLLSVNLHTSLPPSPGHELKDVVHVGEAAQKSSPESLEALDWDKELRDGDKLGRFIEDFLGADGMFLLRIIKANTNRVVMAELTTQLYKLFVIYDAGKGQ